MLRDRAFEGLSIATLVWACSFLPIASLVQRAAVLAVAIAVGALAGGWAQRALDDGAHSSVLDIQMPGMTGIDVAQHVQGRCHVVFVTAYDAYALAAFDAGALE